MKTKKPDAADAINEHTLTHSGGTEQPYRMAETLDKLKARFGPDDGANAAEYMRGASGGYRAGYEKARADCDKIIAEQQATIEALRQQVADLNAAGVKATAAFSALLDLHSKDGHTLENRRRFASAYEAKDADPFCRIWLAKSKEAPNAQPN